MRVFVLGTGSSGNALLVEAEGTRILVEAGIGPKHAAARMRELGGELFPRRVDECMRRPACGGSVDECMRRPACGGSVDGIVVTHHHHDHAAKLEPLCKALGAPVHLHDGVEVPRVRHRHPIRRYRAGDAFEVGALRVRTLPIVHDAPHVALAIESRTHVFGFLTDVGTVTSPLVDFLGACNTVMMEANFCPRLLELGPYPRSLRRRIAGNYGHLSNGQAAALAGTIARQAAKKIFLCHLSRVNNEPELALATVRDRARDAHVEVLPHGRARALDLAPAARRGMQQLSLF